MDKFMEQLKNQTGYEPPSEQALERCLAALPSVRRRPPLLPLLKLQLCVMPRAIYAGSGCLLAVSLLLGGSLCLEDMQLVAAAVSAGIVLLLSWQLMLSGAQGMEELERTCKYGFGQILLARLVCLFGLSALSTAVAALPLLRYEGACFAHVLVMLLPTLLGALAALVWNGCGRRNEPSSIAVFAVCAFLTAWNWEFFLLLGQSALIAIVTLAVGADLLALANTAKRRINCEAHTI